MTRPPRESLQEWYDQWSDDYYWERDDIRVHELMEAFTLAIFSGEIFAEGPWVVVADPATLSALEDLGPL